MEKLDYHHHPIMDGYKFCTDYSKIGRLLLDVNLVQITPKLEE